MALLSYKTLDDLGYKGYLKKSAPEKVLQFGKGNFLRAFVDYFFDIANEKTAWNGKVVIAEHSPSNRSEEINNQDGLYTLYLRGSEKGRKIDDKRIISSVSRCLNPYADFAGLMAIARSKDLEIIVSNTTEAGIVYDSTAKFDQNPPVNFPGKLCRVLYERFKAGQKGVIILSCELIDNNGKELENCVIHHAEDWQLGDAFMKWLKKENVFCTTLVDRIVPGRIRDPQELAAMEKTNGYTDKLLDVGEVFGVWIIGGPKELEDRLPFKRAGLNIHVVDDVTPYKKRKVRILNGAHTGFVLGAYLAGKDIVRDCMHDDTIRNFMNNMIYKEIIPTLPLDKQDLENFAAAVADRFNNPFVNHQLLSISLNSTSKWRARNMPSLKEYFAQTGKLPKCLTMSLAAYIAFFSNDIQRQEKDKIICKRPQGNEYPVQDDQWVLDFYFAHRQDNPESLVHAVLTNTKMWGEDLTIVNGLEKEVTADLKLIRTKGAEAAFASCL